MGLMVTWLRVHDSSLRRHTAAEKGSVSLVRIRMDSFTEIRPRYHTRAAFNGAQRKCCQSRPKAYPPWSDRTGLLERGDPDGQDKAHHRAEPSGGAPFVVRLRDHRIGQH